MLNGGGPIKTRNMFSLLGDPFFISAATFEGSCSCSCSCSRAGFRSCFCCVSCSYSRSLFCFGLADASALALAFALALTLAVLQRSLEPRNPPPLKGRNDFGRIRPNVGFSLLRRCLVKREGINSENRVRSISSPGHAIPFSSLFCGVVQPGFAARTVADDGIGRSSKEPSQCVPGTFQALQRSCRCVQVFEGKLGEAFGTMETRRMPATTAFRGPPKNSDRVS